MVGRPYKVGNMIKGDKVTVTTPWWDEPHEGMITKKFHTPIENYYVIEFPDGEMITMKESEIGEPEKQWTINQIKNRLTNLPEPMWSQQDLAIGYIVALWDREYINYPQFNEVKEWVFKQYPRRKL